MLAPAMAQQIPGRRHRAAEAGGPQDSASAKGSGWFKVIIPHVDIHGILRRRLLAPQLPCRKTDRIQVLQLSSCTRVGNRKNAPKLVNNTQSASCVTREARMFDGVYVASADLLANLKTCGK